ncbi:kinase-like protein [Artomyces pyxidatus]|uniref:Kinase-like protein n=1 Tax=Artomyces pyxidatus TaxID=48021 RepID=A0ACB8TI47_9AGAM|nr:kinase-like protein [Artomyces pyxidatus]
MASFTRLLSRVLRKKKSKLPVGTQILSASLDSQTGMAESLSNRSATVATEGRRPTSHSPSLPNPQSPNETPLPTLPFEPRQNGHESYHSLDERLEVIANSLVPGREPLGDIGDILAPCDDSVLDLSIHGQPDGQSFRDLSADTAPHTPVVGTLPSGLIEATAEAQRSSYMVSSAGSETGDPSRHSSATRGSCEAVGTTRCRLSSPRVDDGSNTARSITDVQCTPLTPPGIPLPVRNFFGDSMPRSTQPSTVPKRPIPSSVLGEYLMNGVLFAEDIGSSDRPTFSDGHFSYSLLAKLGEGASGTVFAAQAMPIEGRHVQQGYPEQVAIKFVWKAKMTASREFFDNILNERRILEDITMRTKMRTTIKMLSVFQTDHLVAFVMELCSMSLNGLLGYHLNRSMILGERNILHYAANLLLCLAQIQALGIVHGDLKLENILLDRHGHLVIGDFGSSYQQREPQWNVPETAGRVAPLMATRSYTPPEALGQEHLKTGGYTSKVDMWACGLIIAELCICERVFPSELVPTDQRMKELLDIWDPENDVRFQTRIPLLLRDLLGKLLRKDPRQRLSLQEAAAHPYFANISWDYVLEKTPFSFPTETRPQECPQALLLQDFPWVWSFNPIRLDTIDWSPFTWSVLDKPGFDWATMSYMKCPDEAQPSELAGGEP